MTIDLGQFDNDTAAAAEVLEPADAGLMSDLARRIAGAGRRLWSLRAGMRATRRVSIMGLDHAPPQMMADVGLTDRAAARSAGAAQNASIGSVSLTRMTHLSRF